MVNDFSQVMSERTDKQLVDIVTLKRDEYQPEAIVAAEKEIELRKIDVHSFVTKGIGLSVNPENKPFLWFHKVFTISIPIIIMIIMAVLGNASEQLKLSGGAGFVLIILTHQYIQRQLKEKGYTKMSNEFKNWGYYTVYIYIIILILRGIGFYIFMR